MSNCINVCRLDVYSNYQNKRKSDELQNQTLKKQKIVEYDSSYSTEEEKEEQKIISSIFNVTVKNGNIEPQRQKIEEYDSSYSTEEEEEEIQQRVSSICDHPIRFANVTVKNCKTDPQGDRNFLNWLYTIKNRYENDMNLSQAIIHFEKMLCLYKSLEKKQNTSLSNETQLNILNALVASAHKFLEQICNFQSPLPDTTHNLIIAAQNTGSRDVSRSEAINLLSNASNWTRYFYFYQKTQHDIEGSTPLLVTEFIKLSLGIPSIDFYPLVKRIFDSAVRCGGELLKYPKEHFIDQGILVDSLEDTESYFSSRAPREVVFITVKTQFLAGRLNEYISKIKNIIKNTFINSKKHADYLKQTEASLMMLRASLNEWGEASDHDEFALWTTWSLLQIHESIENGLRSVIHKDPCQNNTICHESHDLNKLIKDAHIPIDRAFIKHINGLAFKVRYPKQSSTLGDGAAIVHKTELLCLNPEQEGFNPSEQKNTSVAIGKEFLRFMEISLLYFERIINELGNSYSRA